MLRVARLSKCDKRPALPIFACLSFCPLYRIVKIYILCLQGVLADGVDFESRDVGFTVSSLLAAFSQRRFKMVRNTLMAIACLALVFSFTSATSQAQSVVQSYDQSYSTNSFPVQSGTVIQSSPVMQASPVVQASPIQYSYPSVQYPSIQSPSVQYSTPLQTVQPVQSVSYVSPSPAVSYPASKSYSSGGTSNVLAMLNAQRARQGIGALMHDSTLQAVAQRRAQQMASMGLKYHPPGSFAPGRYEGVGWSSSFSPSGVSACYTSDRNMRYAGAAMATGSDGVYFVVVYR